MLWPVDCKKLQERFPIRSRGVPRSRAIVGGGNRETGCRLSGTVSRARYTRCDGRGERRAVFTASGRRKRSHR